MIFLCFIGTLRFQPGETEQKLTIKIIDDDIYEEDEHFYIKLGKVQYSTGESSRFNVYE